MPDHKSVYVVFKTHFDIGFTHLAGEVVARYGAGMLADVVRTCEGTRHLPAGHRFVWTMPTWPLTKSLDPAVAPEDTLYRARALLKDGQITWHTLPFTTHTEFCGLEEYVRGLYRAAELDREYGRRTVAAKMTDVPGHTWMLPAILAHAGVKFLHLGCNPGCMPPDVPRLFWWEAPDGSRVLTFYSKGGYGTSLLPPDDWRYPVWLAMMQTNDNVGPQDAQVVEDMVRTVEARRPGDSLVLGTMDDFYRALLPYLGDEVPVVRLDLADSWIHGVATYPAEVARLRALRGRLADVESWGAGLAARGLLAAPAAAEIEARIAEGYQTALLFGEHTWGLDVKTTLGWRRAYEKAAFRESLSWPETRRIEESWDEQRDRVRAVEAQIEGACRLLPAGDGDIAVYNGLGCPRDAWADLTAWRDRAARGVVDGRDGSSLPLAETPEGLFARVRALPPLSGVALRLTPGAGANGGGVLCDSATGMLENRWVRVRVDRAMGGIASLVDKASGREWVRPGEALGQYRYDVYGNAEITEFIRDYSYRFFDWLVNDLGRMGYPEIGHRTFVARDFEMRASAGAHCASVELHRALCGERVDAFGDARGLTMAVTLFDDGPGVDIRWTLHDKEATPLVESGHFTFPLAASAPEYRFDKLGSVVDPARDIAPGANNRLYCAESFVDVCEEGRGLAIMLKDAPLFSLGEPAIYRYDRAYVAREPNVLGVAFANSWGTNFPQWMGGTLTCRYRLIPHEGDWRQAEIPRRALEWTRPPLAVEGAALPGEPMLRCPPGMRLLALKRAEDGDGYIARLIDLTGRGRTETLPVGSFVRRAQLCDGQEYNLRPLPIEGRAIALDMRPFGLCTLRLHADG